VLGWNARPARTESCPHCNTDLHICLNCIHYDKTAYNDCREPQAERVLEKNVSNFCDYFTYREGVAEAEGLKRKEDALKQLDELFVKKK
jgi:hypothetical protein